MTRHWLPLAERFWSYVDRDGKGPDDCWLWTGGKDRDGYGGIRNRWPSRRMNKAHRLSYEFEHGQIGEDKCILHQCHNRACVNPAHLRAGSIQENKDDRIRRAIIERKAG